MAENVLIVAVTGRHAIVGMLENRGIRVSDILNDSAAEFLRLNDAAVCREIEGECVERTMQVSNLLACGSEREHATGLE